jgi:superfamily II DNA/RNA helicase
MVCTDAAARGIDIPNVTHVIQADFAASAVEFIHRVSRVLLQSCCIQALWS